MSEKTYWLHRISHEWNTAQHLFGKGYLSIGFSDMIPVFEGMNLWKMTVPEFENIVNTKCADSCKWMVGFRPRYSLQRFWQFSLGDIVIVPLPWGCFSICEVTGTVIRVTESNLDISDTDGLNFKDGYFEDKSNNNRRIDIGYLVPINVIENKSRISRADFADGALTSRMKLRQTNAWISDIAQSVEKALNASKPINFYDNVIDPLAKKLLESIKVDLTPDKLEKLVKWYFRKIGATTAYIPPKNEHGKENGADADIIAEFEPMKFRIYAQVKKHDGYTDEWAVTQIREYGKQQKLDDYTCTTWVITTADDFSQAAKDLALDDKENVRLMAGLDFAKALLDAGITNINQAFE